MTESSIRICRPVHGASIRRCERAVQAASKALRAPILEIEGPNLHISRAAIAEAALGEGATMLLWTDADIDFTVEAAIALVGEAERQRGLVGALYVEKRAGGAKVRAEFDLPNGGEIRCWDPNAPLVPCRRIGFGLVAHPAAVLTRIAEWHRLEPQAIEGRTIRQWFTPPRSGPTVTSDDYVFCDLARAAGIGIWADPRWRVDHVGEYGYTLEDCAPRGDKTVTLAVQPLGIIGPTHGA